MTCQPYIRLAPITSGLIKRNPKILLGGAHQPTLLRYLDGWPRRGSTSRAFLIQFVEPNDCLARFASDSFDMAVLPAIAAEHLDEQVRQLVRVARQGLITRPTGNKRG
ncbi:class I SAM-dependent methyltransferase [Pseudomonas sp. RL_15y_Pfl2_60]|uniref:class I SAM-dependent methyltransferase n=1 Tax=Pseudomonas sp. RL_15y_Pfl2_60 TaxID=3088709 RepID=UPI0030D9D761